MCAVVALCKLLKNQPPKAVVRLAASRSHFSLLPFIPPAVLLSCCYPITAAKGRMQRTLIYLSDLGNSRWTLQPIRLHSLRLDISAMLQVQQQSQHHTHICSLLACRAPADLFRTALGCAICTLCKSMYKTDVHDCDRLMELG